MSDHDLTPSERERIRRQEREATAKQRAPMRPGMGKVFKQILDAQGKTARGSEGESSQAQRPRKRRDRPD